MYLGTQESSRGEFWGERIEQTKPEQSPLLDVYTEGEKEGGYHSHPRGRGKSGGAGRQSWKGGSLGRRKMTRHIKVRVPFWGTWKKIQA